MARINTKPLRSVMFVPGNKEDWMRKAPQYGPDALILDLEDSVPEYDKEAARSLVGKMIDELSARGQTLFVRVNRLETGMTGFDLEAVTRPGLYGILLPKVETPADVVEADVLLRYFERKAGMELNTVCIDPGLETAQGIRMAYEIAMASERVGHMGGSGGKGGDTARSVGYRWTLEGAETLYLRSKVLVDARAAGIQWPVSGGWFDIRDLDGLRFWANNIKALGYTGMNLIHPSACADRQRAFSAPTGRRDRPHPGRACWKRCDPRAAGKAPPIWYPYAGDMVDVAHRWTPWRL